MANFVENWRKEHGYSRQKLADKLDMGVATIRMYETGKRYDGYTLKIPVYFRYALAAIGAGLMPVGPKNLKNTDKKGTEE